MDRIFVTGHRGLVGSSIVRALQRAGLQLGQEILTVGRAEVDLRDQRAVDAWFDQQRPTHVYHVAGTVGGIQANNTRPADFLYDNAMMHLTVMRAAWRTGVSKLLYLGSSCIYPREAPQPIREEYLLTGALEPTNDGYAIAKISGLIACQSYRRQYGCHFISGMPTNLYGPGDNFDLQNSHVLPALIRKFLDAREQGDAEVVVWGSGTPRREFLFVDDLADACLHLMQHYDSPQTINIGTGVDVSIAELADLVRSIVYPEARIVYDRSKPDGSPRKLLDVSRLHALGWRAQVELADGIRRTVEWYLSRQGAKT